MKSYGVTIELKPLLKAVLFNGTIHYNLFYKMKFRIFVKFLYWPLLGVKGLIWVTLYSQRLLGVLLRFILCVNYAK